MTKHNISVPKAGSTFEIDFDALPKASQEYIIAYGLRQKLNDSVASIKPVSGKSEEENVSPEDAVELASDTVMGIILALKDGTVGLRASVERDPIKSEAKAIATREVKQALKARGIKEKELPEGKMAEIVSGHFTKNEERLRKAAAEIVELRKAAAGSVDLADMLAG